MVEALLAAFILLPFSLAVLLKSSGVWLFFSACVGAVLLNYVADDFISWCGFWVRGSFSRDNISLALLLLPPLVTVMMTRHTLAKRSSFVLHAVPALCAGAIIALAAVPLLSSDLQVKISDSRAWYDFRSYQAAFIGLGSLYSLFLAWLTAPKHKEKGKKHKR
jgi:hypothetical protein